jgi:integrase
MYADGGGLYLRVAEGGSRQWVFRYRTNGRLRDMGLGPVHTLNLAAARERARQARELRLDGVDPITHKRARIAALRAEDARAITFKECAEGFFVDHADTWRSAKHRGEWQSSLSRYAYPVIGSLPVGAIDTPLVLKVLRPIWNTIPESASRIRQRIESVLNWATAHHYRTGDNPARWDGRLEHALPSRRKVAKIEHHAALPYDEIASFVAKVRADTSVAARCLEFLTLTAVRMGEALSAEWSEIDFATRTWTVPARRTKANREHRVPLSAAAIAALESMQALRHSDYVFPGLHQGRPVSKNSVWRLAKQAASDGSTVHGLRSTFRDWAAERTNFPRDVAEMALAHAIPNAVEAAYRRGDLFEKRRRLMDAWAEFCGKPQAASKVRA